MRVGDRHRQRVRRVRARQLHPRQQHPEHRLDLRLLRPAGADDRLLDQPRGIFGDRHAGARQGQQADPARLAELERRLRIGVDEHFLDRAAIGLVGEDDVGQLAVERDQAFGAAALADRS